MAVRRVKQIEKQLDIFAVDNNPAEPYIKLEPFIHRPPSMDRCINCSLLNFKRNGEDRPTHNCEELGLRLLDVDILTTYVCDKWHGRDKSIKHNAAATWAYGDDQAQMREARKRLEVDNALLSGAFS